MIYHVRLWRAPENTLHQASSHFESWSFAPIQFCEWPSFAVPSRAVDFAAAAGGPRVLGRGCSCCCTPPGRGRHGAKNLGGCNHDGSNNIARDKKLTRSTWADFCWHLRLATKCFFFFFYSSPDSSHTGQSNCWWLYLLPRKTSGNCIMFSSSRSYHRQ